MFINNPGVNSYRALSSSGMKVGVESSRDVKLQGNTIGRRSYGKAILIREIYKSPNKLMAFKWEIFQTRQSH